MSETPSYVSHSEGGIAVTTNSASLEDVKANFTPETESKGDGSKADSDEAPDRVSKAASELGKKGGEASAKAREKARKAAERTREAIEESADEVAHRAKPKEPVEDSEGRSTSADESGVDGVDDEVRVDRPLGKPRDDPRARMLEATREAAELKRQLAAERAERQKLAEEAARYREARTEPEPPKPKVDEDPRPEEQDFDSHVDFIDARSRWNFRQELKQYEAKQREAYEAERRETARWTQIQNLTGSFRERMQEVVAADPSFKDQVLELAATLKPSFNLNMGEPIEARHLISDEIMASKYGPGLLLHFAQNPEEFQRIASLQTTRDIAREMAILEYRLSAATAGNSARTEVSRAKPPVRPVTGSPSVASSEPGPNAPYEEHRKYWNERERTSSRR